MSLTIGPGPFSSASQGVLTPASGDAEASYVEPYPRRVRALRHGQPLIDSENAWMLHGPGRGAGLWFPRADVDTTGLPAEDVTDFRAGDDPVAAALVGYVSLRFSAAERWFVEDEPVYAEIRDPYHRVEVLSSSRRVVVEHAGVVLADTDRPKLLFETGLPVRHYVPWADVHVDLLRLSPTVSECPYKGDGQHWNLVSDGQEVDDVAWSLPHPLPEGLGAAEHVCFYPDKVTVTVDGTNLA